ncbi:tail tape measure protein [Stakelama saccharophila]|uniref:Tail tape measure protein n=1 Tax=Stakelama saccharophila TaxID=3075605 RepID=A0ABZ0B7Y6_9SPHN|nr:tail tape measure protein [Stakelama sp. W311]WNO53540.1 tail tape measure protein [Stakelama sp. W311]
MDEEIERLVVSVRADTQGFARDVDQMRQSLEGPFADGVGRAGRSLETTLARAVRTGKLGFEDLEKVARGALDRIAASALHSGLDTLFGGSGGGGLLTSLMGALSGLPGRATGGAVSPDRPYLVGERGPELFVPTASGQVMPAAPEAGGRDVRVAITINAGGGEAPKALAQSSRQVARAVKAALAGVE